MPQVNFVRTEVRNLNKLWTLIRDCIDGEWKIKERRTTYLPAPNADDDSPENHARYTEYLVRAVFYNVTKRTLAGLVGEVFKRKPVIEVPGVLDAVVKDATGAGVDLVQLSQQACNQVIAFGRTGLLVDYPTTSDTATQAELEDGFIRPTMFLYEPWDIINWRTKERGGRDLLSLVVLHEQYIAEDDGFEPKYADQWRVLRLVTVLTDRGDIEDQYEQTVWRSNHNDKTNIPSTAFYPFSNVTPLDARGLPFNEIPFQFIGVDDNEPTPDEPPLYDLAILNVAHYRNSADYEESCYIVGQPTPWFSGLTQEWVEKVFKGKVRFGSRAVIPLPENSAAGLMQAAPNIQPFEAMGHKERQMVALGAKLVEQKEVQRTATEAGIEASSETSVLASAAKNVAKAFQWGLEVCSKFTLPGGSSPNAIKFELNTEFELSQMSAGDRAELISEWVAGAITFEEMRAALRRTGIATLDDAEAKTALDTELDEAVARETEKAAALTAATGGPPPGTE